MNPIASAIADAKASDLQDLAMDIQGACTIYTSTENGQISATWGDIMEMLLLWAQREVEGTRL
jgi:hypothetical protein